MSTLVKKNLEHEYFFFISNLVTILSISIEIKNKTCLSIISKQEN